MTDQDVPQLRKLIQGTLAQDTTESGDTGIVAQLLGFIAFGARLGIGIQISTRIGS